MSVRFNGIGDIVATFTTAEAEVGDIVKVSANRNVEHAADGESICGLVVSKNGSYVGVQIKGAMKVPCSDAALALGRTVLVADGANGVKKAGAGVIGVQALVVDIDTAKSEAIVIL